jgi:SAM-dependent methyltransferase
MCTTRIALLATLCASGCDRGGPSVAPEPAAGEDPGTVAAVSADEGQDAGAQTHAHRHHGGHHRFENAETWAEHFDDPARDEWQRPQAVLRVLALREDATVADIGAGTGYFAVRLARAVPGGTVLATDVEPDMVRYLAKRADEENLDNLVPVLGRGDDPGVDRPIDLAFSCNVYHHIDDPVALFTRVRDRLAAGGRVVIVDFEPDAPEDAPGPPRAMRVSADAISDRLRDAGLVETRRDTTTLPYQYILELKPADG